MLTNYWIISNNSKKSKEIKEKLKKQLSLINFQEAKTNFKYLFIIGGDGTFIRNANKYTNKNIKIIGINGGLLGFYSSLSEHDIGNISKKTISNLNFYNPWILKVKINNKEFDCMNEIVIHSLNTISLDINIDQSFYEKFAGTGIIISTPTGSTGYSKSLHGSILFPNFPAFQLTEIAPISNIKIKTMDSSIILPSNTKVELNNIFAKPKANIVIDGQPISLSNRERIIVSLYKSKMKINFPNSKKEYISKIRKAFINEKN